MARKHSYHFAIAKGYGALAEIFLRANHAKEALACFQIAYHLMPLRHSQKSRQYNFMASALIRNQEWLRAEALLMTSKQLSENQLQQNPNNSEALLSLLHSDVRLAFLAVAQNKSLPQSINPIIETLEPSGLQIIPSALYYIAKGLILSQNKQEAGEYFKKAAELLYNNAPIEYLWAVKLCQNFGVDHAINQSIDKHAIINLQCYSVPKTTWINDLLWTYPNLNNEGFADLLTDKISIDSPSQFWTKFFV